MRTELIGGVTTVNDTTNVTELHEGALRPSDQACFHQEAQAEFRSLTDKQRKRVNRGKMLRLGAEQRRGWSGPISFYLFRCRNCRQVTKNYPSGYNRMMYCANCNMLHARLGYVYQKSSRCARLVLKSRIFLRRLARQWSSWRNPVPETPAIH